jgi:cyclopropane-fatty-acyl-phospholipid synthase
VQLTDYRHLNGAFDKIVSIEMIEAVGHEFLEDYFSAIHRLLKPKGLLALQMILAPDHDYQRFLKTTDWIQKHIFPGGCLPSFDSVHRAIRKTGSLGLVHYEDLTPSYPLTLQRWRANLVQNRASVMALGFDEAFMRKWNYYFSYCEAAFKMRHISVVQGLYSRPHNHELVHTVKG